MIETGRGRRIAILIGTNEYSKMDKLEFAESDAREMAKILLDPDICGFDEVIQLIDKGKEEVSQNIEKVFKNAKQNDEVLIYYSGHGKPSYKFDLCLLFKDTDPESLLATSLKFDYINECKEQSACKRLVIILDCCYSGTAGMKGDYLDEMLSSYSGSGTILLTSTGQTGSNIAKEDRELKHGVFTGYLLKGLKDWAADDDNDGIITVDDLYKYTFNETKAKGLQRPQKKGSYEGEMILGRNIPKIKHKELEEKNERLMKYLSSAPSDVLYRSLTILQKIYENPSALEPVEVNIKPHLESLIDGKIEVENYIKIVKYQDKIQKQKVEEKKLEEMQEREKRETEKQGKLQKQNEEEQKNKELRRQKEEREKTEKESLETKQMEQRETKSREGEKKARKEMETQEKILKHREETEIKKLEEDSKYQTSLAPTKKPNNFSGKKLIILAILLILAGAIILWALPSSKPILNVSSEGNSVNDSFGFIIAPNVSDSQQFHVSNAGDGNLEWEVSSNEKWITLNPKRGTNSGTVTVTVDTDDLDPEKEYEGTITIESNGGTEHYPVKMLLINKPEYPKDTGTSKYIGTSKDISTPNLNPPSIKDFSADITSGSVPLRVWFTSNTTGNPTSYFWVFEPPDDDWNSKNNTTARHTFHEPGIYSVSLTVENDIGNATLSIKDYINVTTSEENIPTVLVTPSTVPTLKAPVVEEFYADVRSGVAPLKVQFTSKTTDTSTDYDYYWVFEPSTSSDWNSHHPVTAKHTFTKPGNYNISLTVSNEFGSSAVTMTDYINVKG